MTYYSDRYNLCKKCKQTTAQSQAKSKGTIVANINKNVKVKMVTGKSVAVVASWKPFDSDSWAVSTISQV